MDPVGPGTYDIESEALDFLSTHVRSSMCAASLRQPTHAAAAEAEFATPGPQVCSRALIAPCLLFYRAEAQFATPFVFFPPKKGLQRGGPRGRSSCYA
jgi:hypothetical protein